MFTSLRQLRCRRAEPTRGDGVGGNSLPCTASPPRGPVPSAVAPAAHAMVVPLPPLVGVIPACATRPSACESMTSSALCCAMDPATRVADFQPRRTSTRENDPTLHAGHGLPPTLLRRRCTEPVSAGRSTRDGRRAPGRTCADAQQPHLERS
ncbi:unnamed protein product [Lampetra fluviatilis]